VGDHAEVVLDAPHQRCAFELDEHALRPVLKEPLSGFIGLVVAVDEFDQFLVRQ